MKLLARRAAAFLLTLGPMRAIAEEAPAAVPTTPEMVDFFERRVRPVLAERCFACHGSKKQEAGLRLDSRAAILRGSENGPVAIAGQAEPSRLVKAIGYMDDALQMPPDGKLSNEAIADLKEWIEDGFPWTDERPEGELKAGAVSWRHHWAFQPVRDPKPPAISITAWAKSPLDAFILARLEAAGLAPSPLADRRTLVRRLSFDLTGLPPTPEDVERFTSDESPDALERLVDRLLASPTYGQRWGRHWLDVARYADNKGYKFFSSDELYAYTYRDWVIRAFNDDLPYDRFIVEQLAADRLLTGNDTRPLAAMGFLTVGRRFLEDIHDIADDRIDVVSRGLLGLTVSCARCHDHKFDPIPTSDYYSLYGVFAGSVERTRTLLASERTADETAYQQELQMREDALDAYLLRRHTELLAAFRAQVGDYLLAGHAAQALPPTDKFMFVDEPGKLSRLVIGNWRAHLDRTARGHDPIFAPWHAFASLSTAEFPARSADLARMFSSVADAARPINGRVAALFAGAPPSDLAEVAKRYGELFASVERQWRARIQATAAGAVNEAPPTRLPEDADEALRGVLYGPVSPCDVPLSDVELLVGRPGQAEIAELRKKVSEFINTAKLHPPRAMTIEESPSLVLYPPRVFIRGKPSNLGPEVPRQFLGVLTGEKRKPFSQGSGRLELAHAIAGRDNPLTARVLVNRVWLWHFGRGLVETPSDFGLRSEPASHPELLDWLSTRFVEGGWSIKRLHRLIVLSSTYLQASDERPEAAGVDAENRLLWRMNRRRLDLEEMRDSLLSVSGGIDPIEGGVPVEILSQPFNRRRTVYGFVDRQNLPGFFRTFDAASPDAHSPRRYATTVPQQALYLMNNPFAIEQARGLAHRPDVAGLADPGQRIGRLYQLVFGREPTTEETDLGLGFVAGTGQSSTPAGALDPWESYAHALLMSNEFVFLD